MPQLERFIDNLIEMRSHYTKQIQQSDRSIKLAEESLTHINALLVNELSGSQQFRENLTQMRVHYQTIVEENNRASSSARSQLNHINALLADQLIIQQGNDNAILLQASPVDDDLALQEANEISESISEAIPKAEEVEPLQSLEEYIQEQSSSEDLLADLTSTHNVDDQKLPIELEADTTKPVVETPELIDEELPDAAIQDNLSQKTTPEILEQEVFIHPTQKARKPLKQPLLPQYQDLSKSEAIEKLLQEEAGNILHIDDIIQSLFGDLEMPAFKAEKNRLYNTLNQGTENGLWDKVPGRSGCYTIVLEQAIKKPETKKTNTKQQEISAIALIEALPPAYHGLKLTQAVEKVLQENIGQAMNSEKVARVLFGEAEEEVFAAAKNKIGKALWSGANEKRWQGVPGKLGVYIASLEK
ncbi:hypothetical protein [Synechocystis sp. PCC 7509]|uniref:hypothetical protein n=1 Tax=Synechocystis sp. PCC 7509 TaxID=927677 RepID=UPI0002AC46CA|nr:hypothetical protein [Synechocystis sp. PCC 7509]